jgi:hypothetical protein
MVICLCTATTGRADSGQVRHAGSNAEFAGGRDMNRRYSRHATGNISRGVTLAHAKISSINRSRSVAIRPNAFVTGKRSVERFLQRTGHAKPYRVVTVVGVLPIPRSAAQ